MAELSKTAKAAMKAAQKADAKTKEVWTPERTIKNIRSLVEQKLYVPADQWLVLLAEYDKAQAIIEKLTKMAEAPFESIPVEALGEDGCPGCSNRSVDAEQMTAIYKVDSLPATLPEHSGDTLKYEPTADELAFHENLKTAMAKAELQEPGLNPATQGRDSIEQVDEFDHGGES